MEFEIDPRVLTAAKIIAVMVAIAIGVTIAVSIWNFIGGIFAPVLPKPPPSYDVPTTLDYMNWSICQRTDAIQMYIQTPGSTNPQVQRLRADIELYNRMAPQLGKANFSLASCGK